MISKDYGSFDGDSWEELIQKVFKLRYCDSQYIEMPATPGDYGIEGFVVKNGIAFQCYCPDKTYNGKELYEKIRDKMTNDLNKLEKFESQIAGRIGKDKILEWIFITPDLPYNKIHLHCRKKEKEVSSLGLSIVDDSLKVLIYDGEYYLKEIYEILSYGSNNLTFIKAPDDFIKISDDYEQYELNISRKNKIRLSGKTTTEEQIKKINNTTNEKFIHCDQLFRDIMRKSPEVYYRLVKIISQYEDEISEICISWEDTPQNLINNVKDTLGKRLKESIPNLDVSDRSKICDLMVSKWLALCPLDFE